MYAQPSLTFEYSSSNISLNAFVYQMIFLNIFEPDEQEVHVIVNQDMKKILENEIGKFGLKLKVMNVSVDSLVKRTLPVIDETNGKREDAEEYNYSQYEPAYKVTY